MVYSQTNLNISDFGKFIFFSFFLFDFYLK